MTEVRDHRREPFSADEPRAEDHAHAAAGVRGGADLSVVDVSPVLERSEDARVAHEDGALGHRAGVEESAPVDVREIDDHVLRLASLDERTTPRREPGSVVAAATVRGRARFVRAEVEEAQVAHAAPRELGESVDVALERVRAFDPEQRADGARGARRFDLVRGADETEVIGSPHDGLVERIDLLVDGSREPALAAKSPHRQGDEAEELGADAALAKARNVDVPAQRGARERSLVSAVEIVSNPPAPHERVRVEIDRRMSVVESARLVRPLHRRGSYLAPLGGGSGSCYGLRVDAAAIARGRVLIVGAGGIGSPVALGLAHAGVGTIGIVDDDRVERSNLHRQILFSDDDVTSGRTKLDAAARGLARLLPEARSSLVLHHERLLPENARARMRDYDVVVEGADNFPTKFLAADAAALEAKPIVHAAAVGTMGTVLAVSSEGSPCYRCLFEDMPAEDPPNCAQAGVVGPLLGLVAAYAVDLALALVVGDRARAGELARIDVAGLRPRARTVAVAPRASCPSCGDARAPSVDPARYVPPWACEVRS